MPIVSNDRCKSMFLRAGRHEFIPDIFLCAGYESGGQDSCQVPFLIHYFIALYVFYRLFYCSFPFDIFDIIYFIRSELRRISNYLQQLYSYNFLK